MYVIKKDHTHEAWNVQKVVVAVNKSAYRAMVKFTQEELDFICSFVEEKARSLWGVRASPSQKCTISSKPPSSRSSPKLRKAIETTAIISRILCGCWMMYTRKASPLCTLEIRKTAIQTVLWFPPSAA